MRHLVVVSVGTVLQLLQALNPVHAQEIRFAVPKLSVLVTPDSAHVQQQIVQRIRLETNYPFASLAVDLGEIEDAAIHVLQVPQTREFTTYANKGWVYEVTRAIFPNRSGKFVIPSVWVTGETEFPGKKRVPFEASSEPMSISVSAPAQAMMNEPWLVARDVTATESWTVAPELMRAGQISRRTIVIKARGATGEHIGQISMPVSLGIDVLPGPIKRSTVYSDDDVIGELTQSFEIRVLSDKKTDISPVQIAWFDSAAKRLRRASVRAYRIEPLPANVDALVQGIVREAQADRQQSRRGLTWLVALVSVLICVSAILVTLVPRLRQKVGRIIQSVLTHVLGPAIDLPSLGVSKFRDWEKK